MHITHMISTVLRRAALAVTLAASGSLASAAVVHVNIDTSSFGATAGYIDMQFSAGVNVPLQTALVSNMVGFDPLAFIDAWGVTPTGGGYLFRNDTSNDLFHAVDFGGPLSFDLSFAGEVDPFSTYVSYFTVAAFDQAYAPLGMVDPERASLATFAWTPALAHGVDGSIAVNITDDAVTFIPEPSGVLLSGIGLAVAAFSLRRRVKRARQPSL